MTSDFEGFLSQILSITYLSTRVKFLAQRNNGGFLLGSNQRPPHYESDVQPTAPRPPLVDLYTHEESYVWRELRMKRVMYEESYAWRELRMKRVTHEESYTWRELRMKRVTHEESYAWRELCIKRNTHEEKYAWRELRMTVLFYRQ